MPSRSSSFAAWSQPSSTSASYCGREHRRDRGAPAYGHRSSTENAIRFHPSLQGRATETILADWIALTVARGLSLAVVGGLVYVTYIVEMTGFDDFRKCNKNSTITRLERVFGFRPAFAVSHHEPNIQTRSGIQVLG